MPFNQNDMFNVKITIAVVVHEISKFEISKSRKIAEHFGGLIYC